MSSKSTTTKLLRMSEACKALNVTAQTLRAWDREGIIHTVRTAGGHRRIPPSEIDRLQGKVETARTKTLVYARVSTPKQKDNLERQIGRLLEHCIVQGWEAELFKDIGSGLNDNRRGLKKLLSRIPDDDVCRVVVEYKDRLARFGFGVLERYCSSFGVALLAVEDSKPKEFEHEFAEDLIALVASFSARLYGRRGGKRK